MTVLQWAAIGLAFIYGSVSAWIGVLQLSREMIPFRLAVGMLIGGILLAASAIAIVTVPASGLALIPGLLMLHVLAVLNGLHMYGHVHPRHHVIRLILSGLIVVLLF